MKLGVLDEVFWCSLKISVFVVDHKRDAPLGAPVGCSPRASEGFEEAFRGSMNETLSLVPRMPGHPDLSTELLTTFARQSAGPQRRCQGHHIASCDSSMLLAVWASLYEVLSVFIH